MRGHAANITPPQRGIDPLLNGLARNVGRCRQQVHRPLLVGEESNADARPWIAPNRSQSWFEKMRGEERRHLGFGLAEDSVPLVLRSAQEVLPADLQRARIRWRLQKPDQSGVGDPAVSETRKRRRRPFPQSESNREPQLVRQAELVHLAARHP